MNILHTCLRYPPALGGVETYVHEIVERTRNIEARRDVRVLTSSLRTHGPAQELPAQDLLDDPIYVQRLSYLSTPWLTYPRLGALPYYLKYQRPDIIHGYSFWYYPADAAARYAKHNHVPYIFHPMYYRNDVRDKLPWRLYAKTIGHQTFAAADVVAVISPEEQSLIERDGFPVKRFELIPPGINIDKFKQTYSNPFTARGIQGRILLTVSRLAPGKGLEEIVQAMPELVKQHHDIQLVIVGEDFGMAEELKKLATAGGFSQHIHILGRLSNDELTASYQHAYLFIHPSYYEAFGIVLAEAQASGLPVVARRNGAAAYVVADGESGLLFNDQTEMSAQITTLLTQEGYRNQLGQAGVKRSTIFSWNKSIDKILKLYNELQS